MDSIIVHVRTLSGKSELVEKDGKVIVFVKAAPESGKANAEVLKVVSQHFNKAVSIVKGKTSKTKVLRFE